MITTLFLLLSFMVAQDSSSISLEAIEAIQDYENLIHKFPNMKGLNYNLANIHSQIGDLESAMRQYKKTLSSEDSQLRAHALYNMGNLEFKNGNIKESSKLFREALKLSSKDKDILHNYAYSQKILEQQKKEEQQNQDKEGQDNKDNQQKEDGQNSNQKKDDKNQKNQDSSDKDNNYNEQIEDSDSNVEKNSQDQDKQDQNSEKEEKQEESINLDEEKNVDKKRQKTQAESKKLTEEEKRSLQEAEAILNALKADKDNLKKKKYKVKGRIKLEKDW